MSDYILAETTADAANHRLNFNSDGYYVVGDEKWQDITFTTTLIYNNGAIGIAPRIYDTNMYMSMHIHNDMTDSEEEVGIATLDAQITYRAINIAQTKVPPLVVGQAYIVRTEIRGTNYRIYLNDSLIFNVEYPGLSRGKVGIYLTAGNACTDIEVQSKFAQGWVTNVENLKDATASIQELENEDKYLYLSNPTGSSLYATQQVTVEGNKEHTFSFNSKGAATAKIIERDGASPKTYNYILVDSEDWERHAFTEIISADCTKVDIRFSVANQSFMVNDIQFEKKSFATDYIHNDNTVESMVRENSIITYPAKENIRTDIGSISMWVKPSIDYNASSQLKPVLFEHGNTSRIAIEYLAGNLVFTYGTQTVSRAMPLNADEWYNIVATWNQDKIQLYVNAALTERTGAFTQPEEAHLIYIGTTANNNKDIFYGAIDETIVLASVLTLDEVEEILESVEAIADNSSMLMRATFNYAIANFNKSIVEATLTPHYGSPVLVEKADGTEMRKVSFFDFYTGEYRTFNEEVIEYDKTLDYIIISYHDKDVDQENFGIQVEDSSGVKYGSPYILKGRKLFLNLEESEKKKLDGQLLYVTYQLENSYTVDFNIGVPDSFRITLGKHNGEPVRVVYEGNRFTDEKLLTMIELNPMLNPNHQGFLYITRNDEKVASFRVKMTPEDLPANGGDEALIVVEPLDANGNYISHCKLTVSSELGTIIPAYDEESVKLRDRAGRFLYVYSPPILTLNKTKKSEVQDEINVIDEETGIGVQIQVTLSTLEEKSHTILKSDTLEKVAEKYGSTMEDIAYTEDMMAKVKARFGTDNSGEGVTVNKVVSDAAKYITSSVGQVIKIPVNYSSRQLQKSAMSIQHDKMIAYLIELVIDFMNTPAKNLPQGLGTLLDFNGDGMINILEAKWLQENRLTTVLQEKYDAVVDWNNAN